MMPPSSPPLPPPKMPPLPPPPLPPPKPHALLTLSPDDGGVVFADIEQAKHAQRRVLQASVARGALIPTVHTIPLPPLPDSYKPNQPVLGTSLLPALTEAIQERMPRAPARSARVAPHYPSPPPPPPSTATGSCFALEAASAKQEAESARATAAAARATAAAARVEADEARREAGHEGGEGVQNLQAGAITDSAMEQTPIF